MKRVLSFIYKKSRFEKDRVINRVIASRLFSFNIDGVYRKVADLQGAPAQWFKKHAYDGNKENGK